MELIIFSMADDKVLNASNQYTFLAGSNSRYDSFELLLKYITKQRIQCKVIEHTKGGPFVHFS